MINDIRPSVLFKYFAAIIIPIVVKVGILLINNKFIPYNIVSLKIYFN